MTPFHKRLSPLTRRMADDMLVGNLSISTINSYTTGEYLVQFDLENAPGTTECKLDWYLSPDKTEALDFVLSSPEETHADYVFLCQLTLLFGAEDTQVRAAEPFLIALCRSNSFWDFDEPLDYSFFYNTAFDEPTLERRRTYCAENKKVVAA